MSRRITVALFLIAAVLAFFAVRAVAQDRDLDFTPHPRPYRGHLR